MAPLTLEQIRSEKDGEVYPRSVLRRCETALVLFAAGFYGRQDAFWIAEAGLAATCVDIRPGRLAVMAGLYPDGWEFVQADAFAYARRARAEGRSWDLVSVDCPSGMFDRCAAVAEKWCSLAKIAVVLGSGEYTRVEPPDGWRLAGRKRRSDFAGGVYWTVMRTR